ncbi:ATP-binding protein [Micromonospora endolithica]|uniref:Sulfate transporter n=1 Tax=Micromonospora endolithica TaxID=230091 RepID=A0A3A9YXJ1_9ACTN|nr:ATP-binding protein [Micromonospora endolithica]RKN39926.1 sulfate transporter [Micromonospora endolithica]TWJ26082.1 histidine kinase-like protein [Micromonospora endolithica]
MEHADRRTALGVPDRRDRTVLPADVRCRVEVDDSSGVVRLTGVLDRPGAGVVRDALLARLADRPGPVVVDLTGLRVTEPAAGAVFAEVRGAVVQWPAADLLVCDPSGTVTGLPTWPTLDGALAALALAPMAAVLTADLPPEVDAARQARELVTDGCRRWGVATLAEPACIAVTEMVNNVVAHARTPMTVRLAPRDSSLHLAVRDHSDRQPAFRGRAPIDSAGGRGLLLIDTVTRLWGSTPLPDGKVVWCVLHTADEAS